MNYQHKNTFKIKKAIIPVAGYGLRFLPFTKTIPKEMLPIIDKPVIQYAVEELVAAGITQIIFVTSQGKRAIEDYFDRNYELEQMLLKGDKKFLHLYDKLIAANPEQISFTTVRQPKMLGLGHAVYCARHSIGDEPFIVLLPDDLLLHQQESAFPCLKHMIDFFNEKHACMLAVEEINIKNSINYGIAAVRDYQKNIGKIYKLQEKPTATQAISNLGIVGRYILTPEIFKILENTKATKGGEIQLTSAINTMLDNCDVFAYKIQSKRFDCGNKVGYLKAIIEIANKHEEIKEEFTDILKSITIS